MSTTVCLLANTLYYPEGGGYFWIYLNWALGLRDVGCDVIWMEEVSPGTLPDVLRTNTAVLKSRLERYALGERVALCSLNGESEICGLIEGWLNLEAAAEADLLLNQRYDLSAKVV